MLFQINFVKFLNEIKSRYFQYYFLFFVENRLLFRLFIFIFVFIIDISLVPLLCFFFTLNNDDD
jgi:hypothetical protein